MTTSINRNTQINPFEKKPKGKTPDELAEVELETDDTIDRTLKVYQRLDFLKNADREPYGIPTLELEILTSSQINLFLQKIIAVTPMEEVNAGRTGDFLTKLIQDSYNNAHNSFVLDTQDAQIGDLGYGLKGKEDNTLEVTIKGSVGEYFGWESKQSIFTIKGNVRDNCASHSEKSTFNIEGYAGDQLGKSSQHSSFHIKGDVGEWCGSQSEYSSFTIEGNFQICCGWMSEHSTFQSSNKETYKKLKIVVGEENVIYTGK